MKKLARYCVESVYYNAMPSYNENKKSPYSDLVVRFPELERLFLPHIMYPTEVDKTRSRVGYHCIFLFFKTIIQTILQYNHFFSDLDPVDMFWSEKKADGGTLSRKLVVEHGWLPRHSYQVSPYGANGRGAPEKLSADNSYLKIIGGKISLLSILSNLSKIYYSCPDIKSFETENKFIVVPMQLGTDLNLRDSSTCYSVHYGEKNSTEKLVSDLVETIVSYDLPYPVYFTQHPVDKSTYSLDMRPKDKFFYSDKKISTLSLLRDPNCAGVVAVNSNIIHEALCLNIPCCVFGRLYWRENDNSPFETCPRKFFQKNILPPHENTEIIEYIAKILCHQWYLGDLQNPLIVREMISGFGSVVPILLRKKYSCC